MRIVFCLLCVGLFLSSCNDGDIIEVSLDFENTFEACGSLVFYKTKDEPAESLSIYITDFTLEDILETPYTNTDSVFVSLVDSIRIVPLNGTTQKINYRSYSSLPSNPFCSDVPSSDLNIISDGVGTGLATITITLTEDDNDGIPAEFEDINGNGNLDDDDTDDDGIPNYLDDDDDGDNVKTIDEFVNFDESGNLSNAVDTDDDGIPNYLDNDDDGDDVPTRDERSLSPDTNNPGSSVTNPEIGPDYLNPNVTESVVETVYRAHSITQKFVVKAIIENLSIPQLSQDYLNFGTLQNSLLTRNRVPKAIFY